MLTDEQCSEIIELAKIDLNELEDQTNVLRMPDDSCCKLLNKGKKNTKFDHLSFENKEDKFYNNKFMLFNNSKTISDMFGFVKLSLAKYLLDNKVK